jgi:hypothetical protein
MDIWNVIVLTLVLGSMVAGFYFGASRSAFRLKLVVMLVLLSGWIATEIALTDINDARQRRRSPSVMVLRHPVAEVAVSVSAALAPFAIVPAVVGWLVGLWFAVSDRRKPPESASPQE